MTTSAEAAAPERDRLLATKLHVPRLRPGYLARPRLLERQERPAAGGAVPRDYLARLVEAFEQADLPVRPPVRSGGVVVAGLVEPLSPRELEVLGLLADGRSNQAIASQLVISLDTVKRHVSHVLDKLGAANRTQAVSRARDLRLLR